MNRPLLQRFIINSSTLLKHSQKKLVYWCEKLTQFLYHVTNFIYRLPGISLDLCVLVQVIHFFIKTLILNYICSIQTSNESFVNQFLGFKSADICL